MTLGNGVSPCRLAEERTVHRLRAFVAGAVLDLYRTFLPAPSPSRPSRGGSCHHGWRGRADPAGGVTRKNIAIAGQTKFLKVNYRWVKKQKFRIAIAMSALPPKRRHERCRYGPLAGIRRREACALRPMGPSYAQGGIVARLEVKSEVFIRPSALPSSSMSTLHQAPDWPRILTFEFRGTLLPDLQF